MSVNGHQIGGPLVLCTPQNFQHTAPLHECKHRLFVEIHGPNAETVAQRIGTGFEVKSLSPTRARVYPFNLPQAQQTEKKAKQYPDHTAVWGSEDASVQKLTDAADLEINRYGFQTQVDGCWVYSGTWHVEQVECNVWSHPTAILPVEKDSQEKHQLIDFQTRDTVVRGTDELRVKISALEKENAQLREALESQTAAAAAPAKKPAAKKTAAKKPAARKPRAKSTTKKS